MAFAVVTRNTPLMMADAVYDQLKKGNYARRGEPIQMTERRSTYMDTWTNLERIRMMIHTHDISMPLANDLIFNRSHISFILKERIQ